MVDREKRHYLSIERDGVGLTLGTYTGRPRRVLLTLLYLAAQILQVHKLSPVTWISLKLKSMTNGKGCGKRQQVLERSSPNKLSWMSR